MQIGIDSFAAAISDPVTGTTLTPVERLRHLVEEIELADQVGLDTSASASITARNFSTRRRLSFLPPPPRGRKIFA